MVLSFTQAPDKKNYLSIITLDLEYDYGGEVFSYYSELETVKTFSKSINIPINIFVEARLLNDQKVSHILQDWYGDINLHCYDHRMNIDGPVEIHKSQKLFYDTFGYNSVGYRGTRFSLNSDIVLALMDNGFKFDSSYLENPFRSNKFNSINREVGNIRGVGYFSYKKQKLWEFPVGNIKYLNFPLVYSYIALIGLNNFNYLQKIFGLKSSKIFDFHMVDLFPNLMAMNKSDSFAVRMGYRVNALKQNGVPKLEKMINCLREPKYTYTQLMEHYERT